MFCQLMIFTTAKVLCQHGRCCQGVWVLTGIDFVLAGADTAHLFKRVQNHNISAAGQQSV